MSGKLQKRTSGLLASFFIGLIILSFVFTGYYSNNLRFMSQESVATVNGQEISYEDYRRGVQQQLEFFQQLGLKDITEDQLEQFKIKETVLNQLIDKKLLQGLIEDRRLSISKQELADSIKEQKAFLVEGKFDFEQYKKILQANALSPAEYEKMLSQDLKTRLAYDLFGYVYWSKDHLKRLEQTIAQSVQVRGMAIPMSKLTDQIEIGEDKIQGHLQDESKKEELLAYFKAKLKILNQELRLKHQEEKSKRKEDKAPSEDMDVKEVTVDDFEQYKRSMAIDLLRKNQDKNEHRLALDQIEEKLKSEISPSILKKDNNEVKKWRKKYQAIDINSQLLSPLDEQLSNITLNDKNKEKLFDSVRMSNENIISFDDLDYFVLAAVDHPGKEQQKELENKVKQIKDRQKDILQQSLRKDILEDLKQQAKVVKNNKIKL